VIGLRLPASGVPIRRVGLRPGRRPRAWRPTPDGPSGPPRPRARTSCRRPISVRPRRRPAWSRRGLPPELAGPARAAGIFRPHGRREPPMADRGGPAEGDRTGKSPRRPPTSDGPSSLGRPHRRASGLTSAQHPHPPVGPDRPGGAHPGPGTGDRASSGLRAVVGGRAGLAGGMIVADDSSLRGLPVDGSLADCVRIPGDRLRPDVFERFRTRRRRVTHGRSFVHPDDPTWDPRGEPTKRPSWRRHASGIRPARANFSPETGPSRRAPGSRVRGTPPNFVSTRVSSRPAAGVGTGRGLTETSRTGRSRLST
jgi:hypothetical protein